MTMTNHRSALIVLSALLLVVPECVVSFTSIPNHGSVRIATGLSMTQPSTFEDGGDDTNNGIFAMPPLSFRRSFLMKGVSVLAAATTASASLPEIPAAYAASTGDEESMFAPKFVQEYADFNEGKSGWRYRDVSVGKDPADSSTNTSNPLIEKGDRVVFDWSGYTIGYFGRPFQAKGGPQGGAFDKDLDYARTVIGSGTIVQGLEEALQDMKPGGVRQVVIPYGSLSYPSDDPNHDRVGPKPTTFSGNRALNFVLDNPRVDRTLLFNVKLIRVDKSNGRGGFVRG